MNGSTAGLALSTMLASAVEFIEALTIVLAMGLTRGWRSTSRAPAAHSSCSPASLPSPATRSSPGSRHRAPARHRQPAARLRACNGCGRPSSARAGLKELHDEDEEFRETAAGGRRVDDETRVGLDWFGSSCPSRACSSRALEVMFIVITFGSTREHDAAAVCGRAGRRRALVLVGLAVPPAAGARAREHDQVRGRAGASDLRHVLVGQGARPVRGGANSLRWPGGEARCSSCWPPGVCSSGSRCCSPSPRRALAIGPAVDAIHRRLRAFLVGLPGRRRLEDRRGRRRGARDRGHVDGRHICPMSR